MIEKGDVSSELVVSTPLVLLNVAPMAGYLVNGENQGHGGVAGGRGDSGRGGRGADRMHRDEDRHSAKL